MDKKLDIFGTLILARFGAEVGPAVCVGQRFWTFQASSTITRSGLTLKELEVLEVIHEGVASAAAHAATQEDSHG